LIYLEQTYKMVRVYLDSNIFRYLGNVDDSEITFFNKLIEFKDDFIFYYSSAHLSDLSRDISERKYQDLSFMEQLVDKNFLNLNNDEIVVNVKIASPTEAFNNMNFETVNNSIDFDKIFEELGEESVEKEEAKKLFKSFLNTPIGNLGIPNLPDAVYNNTPFNEIIPKLSDKNTFSDLIKGMLDIFSKLYEDPSIWRKFRNYSIENLLNRKFDIDIENPNFNELLKDTPLQKSFLEFVEDSIKHNKSLDKQKYHHFFISAYACLNLLGIDKENNRKVVFSSFQDDAQHAFYAAHCDYLVSKDEQLLLKAKSLYNLFKIETKVLNLDEFKELIENKNPTSLNLEIFTKELLSACINSELHKEFSIEPQNKVTEYNLQTPLFGYFNHLQVVIKHNESPIYTFYKEFKNYSRFISYIEFERLTNRVVSVLGKDNEGKLYFTEDDKNQIVTTNWLGRIWHFENSTFHFGLDINENQMCFSWIPNIKISLEE